MTIPEADAVSTLLRYLAPGSTVPADGLRAAAATVAELLPFHLSGAVRVAQGDSEGADTLAFCYALHPGPDEVCGHCHTIEIGDPHLAALIARLLRARGPLALWLLDATRTAGDHRQVPGYGGLPDHRWCADCQDEECDGLRATDKALAVARTILGAAEQPGGEPAPAEQPVAASTLRPDMVVSHPTWLNGDPVRVVTARVGAGVVAIRYRDVRAHHADVQVEVQPDFQVTPGAGFEDGAR